MEKTKKTWGGARAGAGRPAVMGEKRKKWLQIRMSEAELEQLDSLRAGKPISKYIRELVFGAKK